MKQIVRIGTRGSQLALAQARWVEQWLRREHDIDVERIIIKTTGDRFVDRPLSTLGGKGVFVKEIEDALLARQIDCAVHSMKDVPSELAPNLTIAAIPERELAHDVLLSGGGKPIAALPPGARVGTSSLRRMALLRSVRPDLEIVALRGNVDSRLHKLDAGALDAIILAAAGLRRLGIERKDGIALSVTDFVPAVGQGALAIETRQDDSSAVFQTLNHPSTALAVAAERAFLRRVGGSCRTPLAAHATVDEDTIHLDALIAGIDGKEIVRAQSSAPSDQAEALGTDLADDLLARGGRRILDELAEMNDDAG